MDSVADLLRRWTAEAHHLRTRYGMEAAARLCEAHVKELREGLQSGHDELLSIAQAAVESGYSQQHLRALLSQGSVPNAGAKGRPQIRRKDLPRKPCRKEIPASHRVGGQTRHLAHRDPVGFDARRIVRGG